MASDTSQENYANLFFNYKIWANSEIRTFALSKRWGPQTHLCPPPTFESGGTCPPCHPSPTPLSTKVKHLFWTCLLSFSRSVRIYSKRDVIYTIDRMAFHKTNTHVLQCTIKLIWLDVYWNLMLDKICISFYQLRCYQLLFKELCMNTPNRNQFDTWIVHHACWFY